MAEDVLKQNVDHATVDEHHVRVVPRVTQVIRAATTKQLGDIVGCWVEQTDCQQDCVETFAAFFIVWLQVNLTNVDHHDYRVKHLSKAAHKMVFASISIPLEVNKLLD